MVMLQVLLAICVIGLVLVGAVRITRVGGSRFELQRKAKSGDETARRMLDREAKVEELLSLQRALTALFIIIVTLVSVAALGWVWGVFVALVVSLAYGTVSRLSFVQRFIQPKYDAFEPRLLQWTTSVPYVFTVLRSVRPEPALDPELTSKEQLLHLVDTSHGVLSSGEQVMLRHSLSFSGKTVSSIMTPKSMIDSVAASELLGPLVLDDLHKTGHSRIPVIENDIDHVVGVLHMRDLLTIDSGKRTSTVRKAMDPRVFYIREDQTLDHALAAFLKSHHHLFIVVNEYRETVGLLSLEDVSETLLGRKIIDEFDMHDDLRAVASRNPRGNNQPKSHTDL